MVVVVWLLTTKYFSIQTNNLKMQIVFSFVLLNQLLSVAWSSNEISKALLELNLEKEKKGLF